MATNIDREAEIGAAEIGLVADELERMTPEDRAETVARAIYLLPRDEQTALARELGATAADIELERMKTLARLCVRIERAITENA